MIGIYKITNNLNGKSYIGQSVHIDRRFQEHKNSAKNPHNLIHLAMNKYGCDNFTFEVLEQCDINDLDNREKYYIDYFGTLVPKGYNVQLGGNDARLVTPEEVKEIQKLLLTNADLTLKQIAEDFNMSVRTIYRINQGEV